MLLPKEKENRKPEVVCVVGREVGREPGPGPDRGLLSPPPVVSQCAWTPGVQGLEKGTCLVWEALKEWWTPELISYLCVLFKGETLGFPGGSVAKESTCNAGDTGDVGLIPGLGRSPGGGHGSPLQYSCWRIPWTEEPGGLHSMQSHRVVYNSMHTRRRGIKSL